MNPFLIIILAILVGVYLLDVLVNRLNLRHVSPVLPAEFDGWYDAARYRTAQEYLKERTRLDILRKSVLLPLVILFILAGGFNVVDQAARSVPGGMIVNGLMFAGLLLGLAWLVHLPFSVYATFVIEERYGFNRTTARTFILDQVKAILLTGVIGGVVLAIVLALFDQAGAVAWIYCWIAVSAFQLFMLFIAPVTILPLFNRFTPLAAGELKTAIESCAAAQGFKLKGIYTMDGSRRSAKANAFFTGFGKYRRIALFDTLIARHPVPELVAVLAHEMGHYKLGHIFRQTFWSLIASGFMFYLLSLLIQEPRLFQAFRMSQDSLYAGLVLFGFLYIPVDTLISIISCWMSRRFEFEADAYAAAATGAGDTLVAALKRLSVQHLANLTPHPLKVWLDYSHPPVLRRIEALRQRKQG